MRFLILGKNGMLGHDMISTFEQDGEVIAWDRNDLDITKSDQVEKSIIDVNADVVINCTGYTNVDKAEEEEEAASAVNGFALSFLADACRRTMTTLVHISTDYVFDGEKKKGYNEGDATNPLNAYGRSKALGEKLLVEAMEATCCDNDEVGDYFLVRTSWLFGHHGKNFVDTMLQLAETKPELKVVNDQYGKPTFTKDLCQQIRWLLLSKEYPSGVYHITNEGQTTWYDFAKKIFSLANKKVHVIPCTSEEFARPAKRPQYSMLNNTLLPPLRGWEEALKEYILK